jgi:hypothetical protein
MLWDGRSGYQAHERSENANLSASGKSQFLSGRGLMKTHAIHWRSLVTGTIGTGTKRFEKEEAERLAKELNESYADIVHEAIMAASPSPERPSLEPVRDATLLDAPKVEP